MKINDIVKLGNIPYTHHYMQTMTGEETCEHMLAAPKLLITLANKAPSAEIVVFGDNSLGIETDKMMWAIEKGDNPYYRNAKNLPFKVWQYIKIAMGQDGDTYASQQ